VPERPLLRQPRILALLAAEVISTTGSQMTWLALPWFVLVSTGSATRMTFVVAAELIGLGLFAFVGAKVLARIGSQRTMILCDGLRAPLMLLIPVLHWADALTFGALLATAFLVGSLSAPYFSAQKLIVPELLGEDEALVSRASALFQGATRVTMLLGPVLAGILIASVSAPAVLVFDAATYVAAVVLVAAFVPRTRPAPASEEDRAIRAGLRFFVREPLLRIWVPVFAIGDAAWTAFFVTVPVLVVTRFDADPKVAGWLVAAFGVGAVVGNVVSYRVLVERVRGLNVVGACVLGQALPLWVLTAELPAGAYVAALAASGLANGLVNPSIHALFTLRIPPPLRPTAMTAMMLVFVAVQPLGAFGAGPILDAFGPEPVLVAFAAVQTVAMAAVAVVSFRHAGRAAPAVAQSAGAPTA
jgi:predicted MFS family arabinose efflux permease